MEIVIGPDGKVTMLDQPEAKIFTSIGEDLKKRRASHVEPVNLALRIMFRFLRWITGETGSVSEWARRWSVQWQADMRPSGGPVLEGSYYDRSAAIAAEIAWLMENNYGYDN